MHASDEASIVETLGGQLATARRAREMALGRPVVVGPIMLRPFVGAPDADGPRLPTPDPRQASLFAAGWLVGSISALAASGVSAATYFEGAGTAGFMDRTRDQAETWISPGALFPAFHVFRALAGGGDSRDVRVAPQGSIVAAAKRFESRLVVLVANLTLDPQAVTLTLPTLVEQRVAILAEDTMPALSGDVHWLEHASQPLLGGPRALVVELPRMAVAVITGAMS